MRLRRTLSRIAKKDVKYDDHDTSDDSTTEEDTIVFQRIDEPFSPSPVNSSEGDEEIEERKLPSKHKKVKTREESKKGRETKNAKTTKKNDLVVEPDSDFEVELETVIDDDSKIRSVKEVLDQFPGLLVKAYIKYLHALKTSNVPKAPKKQNHPMNKFSIVKSNNSAKECVLCRQEFDDNRTLARHMRKHVSQGCYTCPCNKTWTSFKLFWDHIVKRHSQRYKCPYCDLTFEYCASLRDHSRKVHLPSYAYLCSICDKKFAHGMKFLEHINHHTDLKPHQCHLCGRTYRSNEGRREHITMLHSGQVFKCSVCDKEFKCKRTFGDHTLTHSSERRYKCLECGKAFKHRILLAQHRAVHRGVRFPCGSCPSSFKTTTYLKRHWRDKAHGPCSGKKGNDGDAVTAVCPSTSPLTNTSKSNSKKSTYKCPTILISTDMQMIDEPHDQNNSISPAIDFKKDCSDEEPLGDSLEMLVNNEPLDLNHRISLVMDIEENDSDDEQKEVTLFSL